MLEHLWCQTFVKKKRKAFLQKSEADEASSDITVGVPVSCSLILRIALQPHAHMCTHTHTHTCTYSGRHACQQRWRALSWLLLNQPFPPQKGACLGEGEGKSWLSEHQTASVEQLQQAVGDYIRVKRNIPERSLPKVGFPGKAVCHLPVGPINYICSSD